jgi:hypothetical protein
MNRPLTYFVGPEMVLALLSTAVFVPIGFVIGIVVTFSFGLFAVAYSIWKR